jgi:hypothetical protein
MSSDENTPKGQMIHGKLSQNESLRTFAERVGGLAINSCLTEIGQSYAIISNSRSFFPEADISITLDDQQNTSTIVISCVLKKIPEKSGPTLCGEPQVA